MPPHMIIHRGFREGSRYYTTPDFHAYHFKRIMKGGRWSLACVFARTLRCRGRCSMLPDGIAYRVTQLHNHQPDRGLVILRRLRRSILRRCRNRDNTPFRQILSQEILRLQVPRNVAAVMPYVRIRPAMLRARLQGFPPLPHTIENLAAVLNNPQNLDITATQDVQDNIFASSVGRDDDRTKCVIFVSRRIRRFMGRVTHVFSDATYDPVPASLLNDCTQIWNISTTWENHTLPLVRVLMQSKSEAAYTVVLQEIRNLVPNFNPRSVMADFEKGQINAMAAVYPLARLKGCIFHYVQKISLKARQYQLVPLIEVEQEVEEIIKSAAVLPLLPRRLLRRGFRIVCMWAHRNPHWNELHPLFTYIRRTWFTDRVLRQLSVYRSPDRTNNVSESDNNQLRIAVRDKHPNMWVFIDGLKQMEEKAWMDIHILRHGGNPSRKRTSTTIANDARVTRLTNDLDAGRISIKNFLRRTSYAVQTAYMRGLNGER